MWQGSSVGQSMRFIPAASRVRISPLLPQCIYPRMSPKAPGGFFCARIFARHAPLAPASLQTRVPKALRFSTLCTSALPVSPDRASAPASIYINDTASRGPRIPGDTSGLPERTGPALLSRRLLSCRKWGILHDLSGEFLLSHTSRTRLASRLLHKAAVTAPAPSGAGAGTFEDSRDSASTFP